MRVWSNNFSRKIKSLLTSAAADRRDCRLAVVNFIFRREGRMMASHAGRAFRVVCRGGVAFERNAGAGHVLYPGANVGAGTQGWNVVGAWHQYRLCRAYRCGRSWGVDRKSVG